MRALSHGLPLAVALGAMLATTAAQAAPNPTLTDKKVRIHVGTDVFSWSHFNPDGSTQNFNMVGFGIGRPTGIDRGELLLLGLTPGVLSIGVGGVILGGRAVIGGQVAFTVDGIIPEDTDGGAVIVGRGVPYFNWMFGPFGRWRPFIGLRFGVGGAAYHDNDAGPGDEEIVTNTIYPIVGLQGGAHAFVADSVSIDLGVTFDYAAPHVKRNCEPVNCPEGEDFEKSGDWLNLAIFNVGLSAWF